MNWREGCGQLAEATSHVTSGLFAPVEAMWLRTIVWLVESQLETFLFPYFSSQALWIFQKGQSLKWKKKRNSLTLAELFVVSQSSVGCSTGVNWESGHPAPPRPCTGSSAIRWQDARWTRGRQWGIQGGLSSGTWAPRAQSPNLLLLLQSCFDVFLTT